MYFAIDVQTSAKHRSYEDVNADYMFLLSHWLYLHRCTSVELDKNFFLSKFFIQGKRRTAFMDSGDPFQHSACDKISQQLLDVVPHLTP
ncbi:hypothetical protein AVEN_113051-1 [Araneus ventricosus]|uniref:Uncharacterized protein n=1 Tax=Araneus ventricosus TaxID=182803 RepID=A0A4Y2TE42_ARAVE|nr:hypothetical protein AVEN_113051-1 [Araneus ventricosus]